jgi:hypothetical protein
MNARIMLQPAQARLSAGYVSAIWLLSIALSPLLPLLLLLLLPGM